jgi:hypothetical protein
MNQNKTEFQFIFNYRATKLARKRALELGYVWGSRGNLSSILNFLIALDD